jgi:transcriptional regulator with XRE-family HTH domain
MMAMASKMKLQRIRQGHTLETLGKATRIEMTRLWMIENGLLPKPEQVVAISRALNVSPRDIFPVYDPQEWWHYLIAI